METRNATSKPGPASQARRLLLRLEAAGDRGYIGEPVSQLEHALQCAAAADRARAPGEVVLAALFHDVGHLVGEGEPDMAGLGVIDHEGIGARFLREAGCSSALAELVEGHVAAKRYLCFRDAAYFEKLSEASRGTLAFQGGPMQPDEAREFEAKPNLRWILALRSWDEHAKDPRAQPPTLETYLPRLCDHLEAEQNSC